MTMGIYKLNFNNTSKVYIGQSVNIERRFKSHSYIGGKGKKLQEAFKLYGKPNLEILHICDKDKLNTLEINYIKYFDSFNNGFNSTEGGEVYPILKGENSGNSKYTNTQYINAFNLLVDTDYTYNKISNIVNMHEDVVATISSCTRHIWLKEMFPDKYKILELKKGKRRYNIDKTNMPKIISPTGIIYSISNISFFAKEYSLNRGRLSLLLRNKIKKYKGWTLYVQDIE